MRSRVALLLASLLPSIADAAPVEDVIRTPVSMQTIFGPLRQDVVVTVFRDDERVKSPYLVLNHGRNSAPLERAAFGRARYAPISRYLVSLGFTVLVPTRIGYGVTGGPDVEFAGPSCSDKHYTSGFDAAAAEVAAVLASTRNLPYVDVSRGLVAGTSFGGMTSIKLAATDLPGLRGAVNFAGGIGGNPKTRPEHPCATAQLDALYRGYGEAAKRPSLWLYSSNDRYWGPDLPHQWFASFARAGGSGQFVQLPPYADNGHFSFTGNPAAWKSAFELFVRKLGLGSTASAEISDGRADRH